MPNNRPIDTDEYPEFKILAQNVKNFRETEGWSQRRLATEMDSSQAYVSVLETCGVDPKMTMMVRLARAFRRPVWHFFLDNPPWPKSA